MTPLVSFPPPTQRRSLPASQHCSVLVAVIAVAAWSPARAFTAAPASAPSTTSDPETAVEPEQVPISPVTPAPDGAEPAQVATEEVEPPALPLPVTPEAAESVAVPAHEHAHDHGAHEHQHEPGGRGAKDARVPARMSPMQNGGWWSLLGAFVLTATAATLGGVSAREQGRRRRLELKANPPDDDPARETEAQLEAQVDVERSRDRGRAYGVGATIVGSVAAASALVGVIVLVVDAAKRRPASARRARLGSFGMEVRF